LSAVFPAVVLVIGGGVLFVVLAIMTPLVSLIRDLI
jgi:hypothetical protein